MYIWRETMMNIYNRYNHYIGEIPESTFEMLYSLDCRVDNVFVAWFIDRGYLHNNVKYTTEDDGKYIYISDEFGIIYKILYDGE